MSLRRTIALFALFCVGTLLPARGPGRAGEGAPRGPFLWEVATPGRPAHLFGTIHTGVALDEVDPVVLRRLDAASLVVVEVDPRQALAPEMLQLATLPPERSLDAMLGAERWRTLLRTLGGRMPEALLRRYRPWFVISLLLTSGPESGGAPMDLELIQRAEQERKKIEYLEEVSHQARLLDRALTLENLAELLDGQDEMRDQIKGSIESYRRGDHEHFTELMQQELSKPSNSRQLELLFEQRNREWLPRLERILRRGDAFVAVGAGHLLTESGLVALLRRRGHRVTRILPGSLPASRQAP